MNGSILTDKYVNLSKVDDVQLDGVSLVDSNKIVELRNIISMANESLEDYYQKTDTYSKTEVNNLIANRAGFNIVASLPITGISPNIIYLVAKQDGDQNNGFDEYIRINNAWEHVGSFDVDLSNYYSKAEVNSLLSGLQSGLQSTLDGYSSNISAISATVGNISDAIDLINGEVV